MAHGMLTGFEKRDYLFKYLTVYIQMYCYFLALYKIIANDSLENSVFML